MASTSATSGGNYSVGSTGWTSTSGSFSTPPPSPTPVWNPSPQQAAAPPRTRFCVGQRVRVKHVDAREQATVKKWLGHVGTVVRIGNADILVDFGPQNWYYGPTDLEPENATQPSLFPPQAFKGEERCSYATAQAIPEGAPLPQAYQKERDPRHVEINEKARREIRGFVARALREWPRCHHSQRPVDLQFRVQEVSGYGGHYMVGSFYCSECASR